MLLRCTKNVWQLFQRLFSEVQSSYGSALKQVCEHRIAFPYRRCPIKVLCVWSVYMAGGGARGMENSVVDGALSGCVLHSQLADETWQSRGVAQARHRTRMAHVVRTELN